MEPVVNGLAEDFDTQVEFRRVDANSTDGGAIFRSFGLRAHPSYIILNPQGEILWRGLGEQLYETIQAIIQEVLGNQ